MGDLNPFSLAQAIAATLPERTILVEEAITGGLALFPTLATAPAHDWLFQTGGAIGWGLPASVGAALAAPERKVLCVEGDGSALYSIPALWTMAREKLDVTVLVIANRSYAILKHEYARVRAEGMGPAAEAMMSIGNPDIDFAAAAQGFGMDACRVETAEALTAALAAAFSTPGPHLIEAVMPPLELPGIAR
jgi:acetolactate synthase-1/2/3 large subunit